MKKDALGFISIIKGKCSHCFECHPKITSYLSKFWNKTVLSRLHRWLCPTFYKLPGGKTAQRCRKSKTKVAANQTER